MMTPEDRELGLLRTGTALDVIAIQASQFVDKHKHRPTLIIVNSRCKAAICVEIMERLNVAASEAIIEPIWLDGIPVVFDKLGDDYIKLQDKSTGLSTTL